MLVKQPFSCYYSVTRDTDIPIIFQKYSLPSSVSCQTMPSRLTLVPGRQGPRQSESPSTAPETPPSCVLVPIDLVLTASCLGLEMGRAGRENEGVEGREDPGATGWPGAGGAGTINMGSTWMEKEFGSVKLYFCINSIQLLSFPNTA